MGAILQVSPRCQRSICNTGCSPDTWNYRCMLSYPTMPCGACGYQRTQDVSFCRLAGHAHHCGIRVCESDCFPLRFLWSVDLTRPQRITQRSSVPSLHGAAFGTWHPRRQIAKPRRIRVLRRRCIFPPSVAWTSYLRINAIGGQLTREHRTLRSVF